MTDPTANATKLLRAELVTEILKLAKTPKLVERRTKKPTVDELEAMLNSDNPPAIHINPDGSISEEKAHTVGDVADAVIVVLKRLSWKPPRQRRIQ